MLVIAFVFERITSVESLSWALDLAISAQSGLTTAVASLNPLHLLSYWYEAFIAGALQCLPSGLADFIIQPARLWGVQVVLNLTLVVFHEPVRRHDSRSVARSRSLRCSGR